MSIEVIQNELKRYAAKSIQEEQQAIREISQELILSGLERAGFFKVAEFQGGTCLRIFHGVQRFSEDLDFALSAPDSNFQWSSYLNRLEKEVQVYGYQIQIKERSKSGRAIKQVFLKADSPGNYFELQYPSSLSKSLRIKLEVDAHPPSGAFTETRFLNFPTLAAITVQTIASLFAGKLHALLSRPWEKGRDWYDFLWYASRRTPVNWDLLSNALEQMGPWQGQGRRANLLWLREQMELRIKAMDMDAAQKDIRRFLKPLENEGLHHWTPSLFLGALDKWAESLR